MFQVPNVKTVKPISTELKDPRMRQIVIEFKPEDGQEMRAPVILSLNKDGLRGLGEWDAGFAIVTDDPPLEIEQAGHDRCPIILEPEARNDWLYFACAMPVELI